MERQEGAPGARHPCSLLLLDARLAPARGAAAPASSRAAVPRGAQREWRCEVESLDGAGNNLAHPSWGEAGIGVRASRSRALRGRDRGDGGRPQPPLREQPDLQLAGRRTSTRSATSASGRGHGGSSSTTRSAAPNRAAKKRRSPSTRPIRSRASATRSVRSRSRAARSLPGTGHERRRTLVSRSTPSAPTSTARPSTARAPSGWNGCGRGPTAASPARPGAELLLPHDYLPHGCGARQRRDRTVDGHRRRARRARRRTRSWRATCGPTRTPSSPR